MNNSHSQGTNLTKKDNATDGNHLKYDSLKYHKKTVKIWGLILGISALFFALSIALGIKNEIWLMDESEANWYVWALIISMFLGVVSLIFFTLTYVSFLKAKKMVSTNLTVSNQQNGGSTLNSQFLFPFTKAIVYADSKSAERVKTVKIFQLSILGFIVLIFLLTSSDPSAGAAALVIVVPLVIFLSVLSLLNCIFIPISIFKNKLKGSVLARNLILLLISLVLVLHMLWTIINWEALTK